MADPTERAAKAQAGIVSSSHLVSPRSRQTSEFEFGMIVAWNAFSRWAVRCMAAAGVPDLTITDVLLLHHVNHRARNKKLADICFVLNYEDTHVVAYSLKKLVADGRIHPAKIEETVAKVRKQLEEQIIEIGERTIIDLDIHGLAPYLVKMVGRMRFRSSYGQNLLKHSIETANLCATMAAELGLSPKQVKMAKRAGLLHDIGKVAEEDSELSHALLGMEICEKYKEHPVILNAVGAHHDEIEMNNIISPIVQACDAISGARPGARREILESYLKRIGELEELALSYEGVQKAYALQAGRELRVIVESEKVSDEFADDLAFMISQKIQDEMQYPGQVKVTVIREKRATAFAR